MGEPIVLQGPGPNALSQVAAAFLHYNLANKRQKSLDQRQAAIDAENQRAQESGIAANDADIKYKQTQEAAAQANMGIDPQTGKRFVPPSNLLPQNHGKMPTLEQQYNNALIRSRWLAGTGQDFAAQQAAGEATELRERAHQAQVDALALRKEADEEIKTQAQIHRWSAQTQIEARRAATEEEKAVLQGESLDIAREHLNATLRGQDITLRGQNLQWQERGTFTGKDDPAYQAALSTWKANQVTNENADPNAKPPSYQDFLVSRAFPTDARLQAKANHALQMLTLGQDPYAQLKTANMPPADKLRLIQFLHTVPLANPGF